MVEPWIWREGTVDDSGERFVLAHGQIGEQTLPIAVVGPPVARVFPVRFLDDDPDRLSDAHRELTFYLVDLGERDPWKYARYHCTTASNEYGRVHWSYQPPTVS